MMEIYCDKNYVTASIRKSKTFINKMSLKSNGKLLATIGIDRVLLTRLLNTFSRNIGIYLQIRKGKNCNKMIYLISDKEQRMIAEYVPDYDLKSIQKMQEEMK